MNKESEITKEALTIGTFSNVLEQAMYGANGFINEYKDAKISEAFEEGFCRGYKYLLSLINDAYDKKSEIYWENFVEDLSTLIHLYREKGFFKDNEEMLEKHRLFKYSIKDKKEDK